MARKTIEQIKHDPDTLLVQCVRYISRMYQQLPQDRDVRQEWAARLEQIIHQSRTRGRAA